MRKVINKMVTEEDLIRTVATAYSHGWRQVKLYFMCGLPTETDEDVLEIADLAKQGDRQGPRGLRPQRHPLHGLDRRVRAQAAHAVPVGGAARPRDHRRAAAQAARRGARGQEVRPRHRLPLPRRQARASSRDCSRAATAGSAAVIEQVWRDGGRFDGWSEHFSYDRWVGGRRAGAGRDAASTSTGTPPASATTTRCCPGTTSTPASTRTGSGRTGRTPSTPQPGVEVEDCRWTPCYDCGVCPEMDTEIQIGPTGREAAAALRGVAAGAAHPRPPAPGPAGRPGTGSLASHRHPDPVAATRAMTVLHATEPATVYLSLRGRVDGVDRRRRGPALYDDRSLVKQLAMRRTLFVFPRDLLPAAWGSAQRAGGRPSSRARLAKEVEKPGSPTTAPAWLDAACAAVLGPPRGRCPSCPPRTLREEVPELSGRLEMAPGKSYGGVFPIAPAGADPARRRGADRARAATPATGGPPGRCGRRWRAGWARSPSRWPAREGYAELVASLAAHLRARHRRTTCSGGWARPRAASGQALADVGAVEVALDGGATGWVLPDDVRRRCRGREPWAALLPVLDPTVMGWKERDFYLGPHGPALFDRNGNAGTTAWWDGRVVGCWVQDDDGAVRVVLLEDVGAEARAALDAEAARLTAWLDGVRVGTVYPSPAMKAGRSVTTRRRASVARCVPSPSSRPRRSSGCGSATPSAAGSASPATATSRRAFERAVFRARVPMAYSSGFNPHPRISYAGAAPDRGGQRGGVPRDRAGRRSSTRPRSRPRSTRRCPTGSTSLDVVESPGRCPGRPARGQPLAARPRRAARRSVAAAVAAFLAADAVPVAADDQEGAARVRLPRRRRCPSSSRGRTAPAARAGPGAAARRARRSAPTTCSPDWRRVAGLARRRRRPC